MGSSVSNDTSNSVSSNASLNVSTGVSRRAIHQRDIRMSSFLRDDGIWEFEATLLDVKAYDFTRQDGSVHEAGRPVHNLLLTLVVNGESEILEASAKYLDAPYGTNCSAIEPAYKDLIGLFLLKGFRAKVKERFGKSAGCTHMSELAVLLPTVFVQSLAAQRREDKLAQGKRPFQLEGCHALALDAPAVMQYYPQWYTGSAKSED